MEQKLKKVDYKFKKPVLGNIGTTKYQCTIEWRNGNFIADEPSDTGGADSGPDPFTLLLSSLASCTLITLSMYINRKGWNIPIIIVKANMFRIKTGQEITNYLDRDISILDASISTEQKNRLLEIAQNCPISKILEGNTKVRTFVYHQEEIDKNLKYTNDEITVVWKPEFCKHSGRCVTQLPEVFNLKAKPWVNTAGADTQSIIDQVKRCPTGALSFFYNDKK